MKPPLVAACAGLLALALHHATPRVDGEGSFWLESYGETFVYAGPVGVVPSRTLGIRVVPVLYGLYGRLDDQAPPVPAGCAFGGCVDQGVRWFFMLEVPWP